ncbi:TIGR03086 family metal-binding protein [Jatrophihabitans telluris]|uniref:TIGR03086 family metal-binding protein n=1 Tax=Jatrophihabitans telluris TaxID=2038343 RepID=A0ABY4QY34_9ACTN|nr:TIGR03086 family metal-binding protein [Jatrophihabitans telluris]UQX88474.1 TIGR03086 family metal-binding protein [Jatrophihabitans telluris]
MDPLQTADLLRPVLSELTEVVGGVKQSQLSDPTPCSERDVAELRRHVVGWLSAFSGGFADPEGKAPMADLDGYTAPDDPAAAVAAAARELDTAVRSGAAERPLTLGESAMPADMALSMILWEYLVHGWDLARATGQNWSPSAAAAQAALDFAPGMLTADYQGEGKAFGPPVEVPEGAPPLDRLVGLSGRDPSWRAG